MISSAIAAIIFLSVILIFNRNNLKGVLVFIVLLPFLPRAIGVGIGGEGLALTARRLILLALAIFLTLRSVKSTGTISTGKKVSRLFLFPMLGFILVSIFASYIYQKGFYYVLPAVEDIALMFFVVFVASNFARQEDSLQTLLKTAFYYPLLVLLPFLCIEIILHKNLLSFILSNQDFNIKGAGSVLEERVRFERYRIQGFSNGPVQLGEYLAYCVAPLFFLLKVGAIRRRNFIVIAVVGLIAIYSTGSRAALASSLLTVAFYTILSLSYRFRFFTFHFAAIAVSVTGLFLLFFAFDNFMDMSFRNLEEGERSAFARLYQLRYYWEFIQKSPIIGFGYVQHVGRFFGLSHFDVFWIGQILQSGFLGMALFLIPFISAFFVVFRHVGKKNISKFSFELSKMMLSTLFSFIILKSVFSFPTSNIYIFMLVAVYFQYLASLSRAQKEETGIA